MKKADISVNTLVMAALALIVLVILVFIFRDQVGNAVEGFNIAGEDAKEGIKGTKCQTLLGDRMCKSEFNIFNEKNGGKYDYTILPEPKGGWIDCSECVEYYLSS